MIVPPRAGRNSWTSAVESMPRSIAPVLAPSASCAGGVEPLNAGAAAADVRLDDHRKPESARSRGSFEAVVDDARPRGAEAQP